MTTYTRNKTRKTKIVVPIYTLNLNDNIRVLLFVQYLRNTKRITKEQACGYRAQTKNLLRKNASGEDWYNFMYTMQNNVGERIPTFIYTNLGYFELISKPFGIPSLGELFVQYANYYTDNKRWYEFFKYIPQLKPFLSFSNDEHYGFGYCCEDCDGDYEAYKQYRRNEEIRQEAKQLDSMVA